MSSRPCSTQPIATPRWSRSVAVAGLALALAAGAVACAGSSSGTAVAQPGPGSAITDSLGTGQGGAGQGGTGQGAGGFNGGARAGGIRPAAFGVIAAVSPASVEVQSSDSQTTVNYGASTTITQASTVNLSAVTVGSCVVASTTNATGAVGGSGQSPATTAAPSAPSSSTAGNSDLTATAVRISQPVNGSCAGAFAVGIVGGGFGGVRPNGPIATTTQAPTDAGQAPTGGQGQGRFGGGFGFGRRAAGSVTSVSPGAIVIAPVVFAPGARGATPPTGTPPTGTTPTAATPTGTTPTSTTAAGSGVTPVRITVTADTVFTKTATATPAALQVGLCASVVGPTNDQGAVTARSIALSTAGAQGCTTRFGGRGQGSGGAPTTTSG